MIIGISNENVFILIMMKIVRLIKIIFLEKFHITYDTQSMHVDDYMMDYKFMIFFCLN